MVGIDGELLKTPEGVEPETPEQAQAAAIEVVGRRLEQLNKDFKKLKGWTGFTRQIGAATK